MRIGIVGGGPAGLYLALLAKRRDPRREVRVVEQNPPGATYGWGVVFSARALSFLAEADPDSWRDVEARLQTWDDQAIVHRDERVLIDGQAFSGIARLDLLAVLQAHCGRAGVELHFGRRCEDPADLGDCDLLVGADGAGSAVRERFAAAFAPEVRALDNRYVWYGTARPFPCLTLTFRESSHGAFVAHHYRHAPGASTFVVECEGATWARAGLDALDDAVSRRLCEAIFAPELADEPLLSNGARWTRFREVTCRRWRHGRVALIGDALRSVHFSIGSGTRTALEDAIALASALDRHADPEHALAAFEAARRPEAERLLAVAARSARWYERFSDAMALPPVAFAHAYLTRGGRIDEARLRARSPGFAAAWAAQAGHAAAAKPRQGGGA